MTDVHRVLVIPVRDGPTLLLSLAEPQSLLDALRRAATRWRRSSPPTDRGLEPSQATQVPVPGPLANLESKVDNLRTSTTVVPAMIAIVPIGTASLRTVHYTEIRHNSILYLNKEIGHSRLNLCADHAVILCQCHGSFLSRRFILAADDITVVFGVLLFLLLLKQQELL